MKIPQLIHNYRKACNDILHAFQEHYGFNIDDDVWVANEVGGVFCVNDEYFIDLQDAILMLSKDVSWNEFIVWWNYNLDAHTYGFNSINLISWLRGAPRKSKEEREEIRKAYEHIEQAKREFEELCKKESKGTF